ncbi:MAG: flagellar biosynthesis protein FlhB [Syntrophomonadaceae bacterium]|nr:flagellar biosynthesis protein FlhB [Syntrophomonadaceae bacterium]
MEREVPDKKAVALKYNSEEDEAPRVVAKGAGYVAEKIEKLAQESGVPVKQDQELVEYLSALNLYEEIPPSLYTIVAEILAFVYHLDSRGKTI